MGPERLPFLSILLAIRDEVTLLPGCLRALAVQDYPAERMEVIVANGESMDGSSAIIEAFAVSSRFPVRLISNSKRSTAAGFNAGLRIARGSVIVILGARGLPAPNFLSENVFALEESGADAAGGIVSARADGMQARAVALALGSRFGVGDARYRYAQHAEDVDTINYGAYRREVFENVGGFDETMRNVEDDEFNYRLRSAGKRLYLSPRIRCEYVTRPSLASLTVQFARYGYPKVRVMRRHPRQMRPRQFAPAAFVGALLLSLAGYHYWTTARRLFWLVAASYAVANAGASVSIARRKGVRYLPLLPVAFAGMHFGYGSASLAGVLRFFIWPLLRRHAEPSEVPNFSSVAGTQAGGCP